MIDFVQSFKSLIKLEQINNDNNVFKLHYKVTVILLTVFSILLTSKQYFGDPILCDTDLKNARDVVETYCWITGTFTVEATLKDEILPGLGNEHYHAGFRSVLIQKYYQWVCIVFCFQALLFYLPRYLWKTWEGGRLRLLVADLTGPLVTTNWTSSSKSKLIQYILGGRYSHNVYTIRYSICECLNFINVLAQMFMMNWFLTGRFAWYGLRVLTSSEDNPMTQLFPKITKCTYNKYGKGGSVEIWDALCILPLNILNEKFFVILWFWLLILLVTGLLMLIYRACFLFVPKFRMYLLVAQARFLTYSQAKVITDKLSFGDFFLLYHIGKNVNPLIYRELVVSLREYIVRGDPCKLVIEDHLQGVV